MSALANITLLSLRLPDSRKLLNWSLLSFFSMS